MIDYDEKSKLLKAVSDANRLKIIDILSCGERCACDILEKFDFTQPTLSHHMKILTDAGFVKVRKDGIWNYYSLEMNECNNIIKVLNEVFHESENCICKTNSNIECKC